MRLRRLSSGLYSLGIVYLRSVFRGGVPKKNLEVLFDRSYYLVSYPDVRASRWNPLWHYFLIGAAEHRNPNPAFDTAYYVQRHPDVGRSTVNALAHYVLFGFDEGRKAHPEFDTVAYFQSRLASQNGTRTAYELPRRVGEKAPDEPSFTNSAKVRNGSNGFSGDKGAGAIEPITVAESPSSLAQAKLRLYNASERLSEALSQTDMPLVSVIIPCFNYGEYVWDAVGSILAQTYPRIEIIVVDDGSTDPETVRVLSTIRNDRVRVIHQFNLGLAQSRNNGVAAATGDFLLFLDADDRLERHGVGLMLYALLNNSAASFAYTYQRFFGDKEFVWETQPYNAYDILWSNHPSVCCLMRRRAFEDVGGYRPEMLYCYEDWEIFVHFSSKGQHGLCVPAPVFEYRRHGVSMAPDGPKNHAFLCRQMLALNSGLYQPETITAVKARWRPLISVIIPFYNSPQYLKDTLSSLERQTVQDFEVILVNDGSDDPESLHLLDEIRSLNWVRLIDCEHLGLPSARNKGACLARAELIMFLDSDDLLDAGALEKLCWAAALAPSVAFIYSGTVHFGDINEITYNEFDPERLRTENFLTATCVMRREIYLELGGNDAGLGATFEDYDFWLRLVERGYRGRLFSEPLFHYRRHAKGILNQKVMSAGVGIDGISRAVLTRHQELHPCLPTLESSVMEKSHRLIEEASTALNDLVPAAIARERYRRPNLPNLFCKKRWSGDRISILYLIPWLDVGGAEAFDLRIMSCLPKERFSISLVACERSDGFWRDRFEASADQVYALDRMAPTPDSQMQFLRYLMISKSVDIVVNRNTFCGYELSAKWRAVSPQVRYFDILHLHAFGNDWVRASAPYDDKIDVRYVTSEDLPAYAERQYGLSPERFTLLNYGLEPDEIPNEMERNHWRHAIRKKWDIPESAFVVGFSGRLTEQKDPLRWLSTAMKVAKQNENVVFLVVGDGELTREMRDAAARLGPNSKIIFAGYQADSRRYCAAMDVLLMQSKYEGLPLTVLESLAHGTPVVTSDAGGIRWAVNEQTGRVLSLDAGDDLYAAAVLEFMPLEGRGSSVSALCRERVASRYTKDRMRLQIQHDFTRYVGELKRGERLRDYQIDLMSTPILP